MKGKGADGAAAGTGFVQRMEEIILDIGAETEDEWTNALVAGQILKSLLPQCHSVVSILRTLIFENFTLVSVLVFMDTVQCILGN